MLLDKGVCAGRLLHLRNAVQQTHRSVRQQGFHLVKKLVGASLTYMTHHADGDDAIPLDGFIQFQIMNRAYLHRQPATLCFLANISCLIVTQSNADAFDTISLGGMKHEMTPAAADVQEAMAGLEM